MHRVQFLHLVEWACWSSQITIKCFEGGRGPHQLNEIEKNKKTPCHPKDSNHQHYFLGLTNIQTSFRWRNQSIFFFFFLKGENRSWIKRHAGLLVVKTVSCMWIWQNQLNSNVINNWITVKWFEDLMCNSIKRQTSRNKDQSINMLLWVQQRPCA